MFTLEQIQAAHAEVRSGADFPKYVQSLIKLGITHYESYVCDGHTVYYGASNLQLQTDDKYTLLSINKKNDIDTFKHHLKLHQQGESDYLTFCNHCAETGIEKWIIDMHEMTCSYYDHRGNILLRENIPSPSN